MIKLYHVQTFSGSHQKDFLSKYAAKEYKRHLIRQYGFDPDYIEIESYTVSEKDFCHMDIGD